MNSYGEAAVRAIHIFTTGAVRSPKDAWSRATSDIFGAGTSSQKKGCPQNAFLGLCEEGIVRGIPSGQYTRSQKNKKYDLDALAILRQDPDLVDNPDTLWHSVMKGDQKNFLPPSPFLVLMISKSKLYLCRINGYAKLCCVPYLSITFWEILLSDVRSGKMKFP